MEVGIAVWKIQHSVLQNPVDGEIIKIATKNLEKALDKAVEEHIK